MPAPNVEAEGRELWEGPSNWLPGSRDRAETKQLERKKAWPRLG